MLRVVMPPGTPNFEPRQEETADTALGGAVKLFQPAKGYRFSIDSVLLARFAAERPVDRAIDLGCGCGVVGLSLLKLGGAKEVVGIDLQPDMVDRATRSAAGNGFGAAASFSRADLRRCREAFRPGEFDLVTANPPYRPVRTGRMSPNPAIALARHEVGCELADVVSAAFHLLTEGDLCLVYPARRLAVLLAACAAGGVQPKLLRLVHPREHEPAILALLRCTRGASEGMEVRPPLVLHAGHARYSEEADRLLGPPETPASD